MLSRTASPLKALKRLAVCSAALAAAVFIVAAPAFAQVEVVAKYRGNYPTPMTAEQKVDLLRHVAVDVHGGLVVKRDRNGNPEGTNCGGYSCDIVCFSDVTLFDVLQDQDVAALPRWDPTTNPRGYRCELVGVTPPLPGQSAPPTPALPPTTPQTPPVSFDLTPIFARLEALYQQHERIYADETNQRNAQTATLKAAIDEPAFIAKFFGNRYVQLALATFGTYLTTEQMKK